MTIINHLVETMSGLILCWGCCTPDERMAAINVSQDLKDHPMSCARCNESSLGDEGEQE